MYPGTEERTKVKRRFFLTQFLWLSAFTYWRLPPKLKMHMNVHVTGIAGDVCLEQQGLEGEGSD